MTIEGNLEAALKTELCCMVRVPSPSKMERVSQEHGMQIAANNMITNLSLQSKNGNKREHKSLKKKRKLLKQTKSACKMKLRLIRRSTTL